VLFVVVTIGVLFMSCATAGMSELKKRAAFEFRCTEGQLEFTDLGDRVVGVSGCGEQATYRYEKGSWLASSVTTKR
jgi:hypothetical protein